VVHGVLLTYARRVERHETRHIVNAGRWARHVCSEEIGSIAAHDLFNAVCR